MSSIRRWVAPWVPVRAVLGILLVAALLGAIAPAAFATTFVDGTGRLIVDTDDALDPSPDHTIYVELLPEVAPDRWEITAGIGSATLPVPGAGCTGDTLVIVCPLISNAGLADPSLGAKVWLGKGSDLLFTGNFISAEMEVYGEEGSDEIYGGEGPDKLYGGEERDFLNGYDGNDFVSGGDGDFDVMTGGLGTDTYDGGLGTGDAVSYMYDGRGSGVTVSLDNVANDGDGGENIGGSPGSIGVEGVIGSEYADTMTGDVNSNMLRGMGGVDHIYGLGGSDHLIGDYTGDYPGPGGAGDYIDGGSGNDSIFGDEGNDTIAARDSETDATLDCGFGTDVLTADGPAVDASTSECETVNRPAPPSPPITAPVNIAPPEMSGLEAKVGVVLSGSVGTWTAGGGNNIYFGMWRRCEDLVLENCETVGGGVYPEGSTYTITSDDIGHRMIWAVVALNEVSSTAAYAAYFTGVVPDPNAVPGSNGEGAGSPKVKPPVVDHTPAQKSSACQAKLNFGPIGVRGSCLKRVGLTWESSAEINVNGIRLVPSGASSKLIIDPMNLRIGASGKADIIVGPATVAGRQLGPYTIYSGSFNWVFQPKIQLPDVPGLATALDYAKEYIGSAGVPAKQSVNLDNFSYSDLQKLPGLEGLSDLPRISGLGLPDFSKVTVADLKKLRIPTLDDISKMQIPAYYLQNANLPPLALDTKGANIFGFGVEGKAAMQLVDDGANFNVALALKQFGNISASADFKLTNSGTIQTGNVKAHADEVDLGIVGLRPFDIAYDGASDSWAGKATAFLPFPDPSGIGADVRVEAGKLRRVGLNYDGNLAVGTTGVFMSHLDFTYDNGPPKNLSSNVSLTAGPKLAKLPPAVELNGKFEYEDETDSHYAFYRLSGKASLVGIPLAKGLVEYYTNGYFHAAGSISYYLDAEDKYGFKGSIDGWATKTRFNLEGDVKFSTPGFSLEANALVSSVGVAGCASVKGGWFNGFSLGAGYKWNATSLDWLGGTCDLSKYRAVYNGKASLAADGFTRTVDIKPGERAASWAVKGAGAAPKVTLSGPGGTSVSTPAGSLDGVRNDRFILIQDDMADTTYVVVGKPKAGKWTITAQDGSAPVTGVDQAGALPPVDLSAKLKGGKSSKTLSWKLKPQAGQKVRFVERADTVARVLAETNSASGKVKFTPAEGPKGKRYIEAVVEQDGMVRKTIVVARFVAPKPAKPAAPKGLKVKRSKSNLIVTWKAAKGADRYRVLATVNGGRKMLVTTTGKQRRAVIEAVFPDTAATIQVIGVDGANRAGKPAKAKLTPKKIKKPKLKGLKAKKKSKK